MPPPVSGSVGEADWVAVAVVRGAAALTALRDLSFDGGSAVGSISDASTPENSATRRVSEVNSMALRNAISRL